MRPTLRRVHPFHAGAAAITTVAEAYDVERRPHPHRPWVGLCMVVSLDGAVTVDGSSGGLGNPNDRELLITLRRLADVIVVGAGTARGEGYGPPRKQGQRIGVVTNRGTAGGSIDPTAALFTSGAGFLIAPDAAEVDADIEVLRAGEQVVDLALAISTLDRIVPELRYVQAEGGPTLNAALLAADLIDELDLTISPRVVGNQGPRMTAGAGPIDARFDLAHLLIDDDGFVFGRWTRRRPASDAGQGVG
jgi:riboflavin biosynthesis pyrimidine reductase